MTLWKNENAVPHTAGDLPRPPERSSLLVADPYRFPSLGEVFGSDNPVEIEIGCGKGKFLIARAMEQPDINFLGVDVVWKWMKFGVQRSDKRGLVNIRFVKIDARKLVTFGIPTGSVSIFHVYFPDPWPKRRHRKRRLITGEFLHLLHSRLQDEGLIELATDHEDYFAQIRSAVIQSGIRWRHIEDAVDSRLFAAFSKTNYEIKYESAGRTLHYLELQK